MSVGRFGSPGLVTDDELLHSVLMKPADLDDRGIAITLASHAYAKGMSMLRGRAATDEFIQTVEIRQRTGKNSLNQIATLSCSDLRALVAEEDTKQRSKNDRLFYVLDTDTENRPHHCDVLATVPKPVKDLNPKSAWKLERQRILK